MFADHIYMAIWPSALVDLYEHTAWNTYNEFYKFSLFPLLLHQFIPKFLLLYVVICIKILNFISQT